MEEELVDAVPTLVDAVCPLWLSEPVLFGELDGVLLAVLLDALAEFWRDITIFVELSELLWCCGCGGLCWLKGL